MLIAMSNIHMILLMQRLWLINKDLFRPWLTTKIITKLPKLTRHIQNAAVDIPQMANPFQLIAIHQAFTITFQQAQHQGNIPTSYGVAQDVGNLIFLILNIHFLIPGSRLVYDLIFYAIHITHQIKFRRRYVPDGVGTKKTERRCKKKISKCIRTKKNMRKGRKP